MNSEKILNGLNIGRMFFNKYYEIIFWIIFLINTFASIIAFILLGVLFVELLPISLILTRFLVISVVSMIVASGLILILNSIIKFFEKKQQKLIFNKLKRRK